MNTPLTGQAPGIKSECSNFKPLAHSISFDDDTLRSFFAGLALHSLQMTDRESTWETLAKESYKAADAMLEARKASLEVFP